MSEKKNLSRGVSRRKFIATTAAAAVAARFAKAQTYPSQPTPPPAGPWKRVSLTDPDAPAMLAAYKTAIKNLIALPATDARNFYRNAFVHTLDCPHGNWWFLPWHRGYLGWWEQVVREFSGNQNFAFPYWDWTAQPFVPDAFWQDELNPENPPFIATYDEFFNTFNPVMTAFYNSLTPAQAQQIAVRPGLENITNFWNSVCCPPNGPMFFPLAQARSITQQQPHLDPYTSYCVSLPILEEALATPYFEGGGPNPPGGFGSDIVAQHSESAGQGILESMPHNNVHNDIGNFMGNFLSPVDPIFMAHHSNIDRIWTLWTAQQEAAGQPTLPTGAELAKWQKEPFLFYINPQGKPVTQNTAGDYATIGAFNYTYTRGSGAPPAGARETAARATAASVRRVTATVKSSDMNVSKAAVAQVSLPGAAAREGAAPSNVRAHITVQPPPNPKGVRYHVFVNPPENELALDSEHPSYAATFEFFGGMHHAHPVTFTVPLDQALQDLTAAKMLDASKPLNVVVVPQTRGVALRALPKTSVTKVEVTTF